MWPRGWPPSPPQSCVGQTGQHDAAPRFSPGSPPDRRASGNTGTLSRRPLPGSWVSKPCPSCSLRLPRMDNGWAWEAGGGGWSGGRGLGRPFFPEPPHPWTQVGAPSFSPLTLAPCPPLSPGVAQEPQGQRPQAAETARAARTGSPRRASGTGDLRPSACARARDPACVCGPCLQ